MRRYDWYDQPCFWKPVIYAIDDLPEKIYIRHGKTRWWICQYDYTEGELERARQFNNSVIEVLTQEHELNMSTLFSLDTFSITNYLET